MKNAIILAPKGLQFDEQKHEYFLDGKILSGVTKRISRRLGMKMPEEFVGEAQVEGLHIHKAIETWLNGGLWDTVHPGALWVKSILEQNWAHPTETCQGEVLVSDGTEYASSVDIIARREANDKLVLYDIKRSFKRVYVTWQLSIYKYFIEQFTDYRVDNLHCLAVNDRTVYPIFPYKPEEVKELLYGLR